MKEFRAYRTGGTGIVSEPSKAEAKCSSGSFGSGRPLDWSPRANETEHGSSTILRPTDG